MLAKWCRTPHIGTSANQRIPHTCGRAADRPARLCWSSSYRLGRSQSVERRIVHKFGGTSVASAERYRHVAGILASRSEGRRAVVVSAMSGVTDGLVRAVELAARRDRGYLEALEQLRDQHRNTIVALVPPDEADELLERLDRDFTDVADVLHATWLLRSHSERAMDLVTGYGEIWSAQMLAGHLGSIGEPAGWLDARDVLVVAHGPAGVEVDWRTSSERLVALVARRGELPPTLVVTGYVAATADGLATTLGRNGSDLSASIFAALLEAAEIHIWTDVDGVMSANPRLVPDAVLIDELSYNEAMELAYFGARVIHPSTMAPAVRNSIPIFIRNTFQPDLPGTRIHLGGSSDFDVKGFATIEGVSLVNVEGTGMIGVPGTAHRLFGALHEEGVSVTMISQGSSEHSICFVVPGSVGDRARSAVERAFFAERHYGQVQTVELMPDCCVLAVVGDRMAGHPGVAGKFFGSLGKAGVNIRAIAQGSSERNISVVIDNADASRALRAVHGGFYLSPQTLSIGVVGCGLVGGTLLDQLAEQARQLKCEFNLDLRVRAIATSKRAALAEGQLDLGRWRDSLGSDFEQTDLAAIADHVHAEHLPHAVIIDCTASETVAQEYAGWLKRGIHVITPNKRANTADLGYYQTLRRSTRDYGARYLYETTVGAGLPIIQTLRDLVQTGDEIREIEGILSGTLSYLFNVYDGTRTFSEIVADAKARGFTEPDPRDDLSGMDVGRKVVILAREIGIPMGLKEVEVEGLVPHEMEHLSVPEFLEALPTQDAAMAALFEKAQRRGEVLRYVGRVDREGNASARLQSYPLDHPFARIQMTDNIVLFRTRRYQPNPLVVQGPGAGPEVTAGGVFADLLRLSSSLGASL
ncbi:MAG: bifunctional aspartate kinase/homoserine dehydrogenase I [Gemmatimonas sp.]|nr:bifunctional aspartate kinase/homoserine dehydrogenase I [Gemmatimonas sp.]